MLSYLRRQGRLGAVVAIIFVVTQIVIPTVMLFEPRPARFSWQMYSGVRTLSEFVIVREDGSEEEVDITDFVAHPRSEVDLADSLPEFICERESDVSYVRIEPMFDGAVESVPCRR